jgi:predicted Rossmann fold flavoprotein
MEKVDVIIVGAGAAGLMCAIEAGKRGRSVVVLDSAKKAGNKIRMAGGGKCNFTNLDVGPEHFLCGNPHFVKSALSRYTQWDFIAMVQRHGIAFHQRDHGQLFCDHSSQDILDMLRAECDLAGVAIRLRCPVTAYTRRADHHFVVTTERGSLHCQSLVIATGGLSIPTMGASPYGYQVAEHFGLAVVPTSAGLVPLTLHPADKERFSPLTGIAVPATLSCNGASFTENLLFTHRGLSGPAVLQISNYWYPGDTVTIDWLPGNDLGEFLHQLRQQRPKLSLKNAVAQLLPERLATTLVPEALAARQLAQLARTDLDDLAQRFHHFAIKPNGTEGYRTAEVTRGGVDVDGVSSKTFAAIQVPGLFFIGEVLDVSGWLGGYNLQWAWASGWCAGQYV